MTSRKLAAFLLPGPGALLAMAVAVPAALAKLSSFDLFFNIASGRWILSHGFPAGDPFSLTAAGSWFPHEWAYGVLAAESVRLLGGAGPAILSGLLLAAATLIGWRLIVRAHGRDGLVPLVLFLLVLAAQSYFWQAQRAYLFGYLFFVLALLLITNFERGRRRLIWLLVPICAVWANLHGSWLVGPVLLGAFSVGRLIDRRAFDRSDVTPALVVAASCLAAALSPRGFQTCLYPLGFMARSAGEFIWEWSALDLSSWSAVAVVALMVLYCYELGRSRGLRWSLGLPIAGLSAAAIMAERHAPLAALMLAIGIAELFSRPGPAADGEQRKTNAFFSALSRLDHVIGGWCRRAGGQIWPFAALAAVGLSAWSEPAPLAERIDERLIPVRAIERMCDLKPGKVLNRYFLGGAISALCGPEFKVFIDGRNDLFPRRIQTDYRALVSLEPGWNEIIDRYDPRYLLWSRMNYGSALLTALRLKGGWRVVLKEQSGMLWVKESDWPEQDPAESAGRDPGAPPHLANHPK